MKKLLLLNPDDSQEEKNMLHLKGTSENVRISQQATVEGDILGKMLYSLQKSNKKWVYHRL